jgi:hypothetical protein
MPCNHKFKSDLDLERIDFKPTTLVVGTFIPEWPANTAEWFYGRTRDADGNRINNFWDILPRIYNEPGLIDATPHEWKMFCNRNQVAITDLISSIDDAHTGDPGHNKILAGNADDAIVYHFDDFVFVNIVQLLKRYPSIRNVYLTRGVTEVFWRHVWNPVMQYCNTNHIHERRLITPFGNTLYQHDAYNNDNPGNRIPLLEDYLLMRWKKEWHF